MATTHGKDGQVRIGANQAARVESWNMTLDGGWADIPSLQDEWNDQLGGIKSCTGAVNCYTDTADTNGQVAMQTAVTGATTARLYLYINSTQHWEFDAHLDLTDTVAVEDVVRRNFNFRNSSTVSLNN